MDLFAAILIGLVATETPTIANPGFESVDEQTGIPLGWSFTSLPNEANLVRYATKKAIHDDRESRVLLISVAADHPDKKVAYNAHQDVRGFVAGRTYRVTAKVRAEGLQTLPLVAVQCLDESGTKCLAFSCSQERRPKGDVEKWEPVETQITVPKETSTLRLRIGIPAEGNAGGIAMIDEIKVVEVP